MSGFCHHRIKTIIMQITTIQVQRGGAAAACSRDEEAAHELQLQEDEKEENRRDEVD